MEYFDLILKRQSCRSFDPTRPVEKEKILRCVEAACGAPSACDSQPWHFHVVTGQALKKALPGAQKLGSNRFADDCTALVFVTEDFSRMKPIMKNSLIKRRFPPFDCGLAVAHFLLAAEDQSIGTCCLGMLVDEKINAALGLDANTTTLTAIAMGYPKAGTEQRKRIRQPAEESVTWYE